MNVVVVSITFLFYLEVGSYPNINPSKTNPATTIHIMIFFVVGFSLKKIRPKSIVTPVQRNPSRTDITTPSSPTMNR